MLGNMLRCVVSWRGVDVGVSWSQEDKTSEERFTRVEAVEEAAIGDCGII